MFRAQRVQPHGSLRAHAGATLGLTASMALSSIGLRQGDSRKAGIASLSSANSDVQSPTGPSEPFSPLPKRVKRLRKREKVNSPKANSLGAQGLIRRKLRSTDRPNTRRFQQQPFSKGYSMRGFNFVWKNSDYLFILIAVSSLLIQTQLLSVPPHGDVRGQQLWGNHALKKGVASLYTDGQTDYPPLYLYVLKFNAWLNVKISGDTEVLTKSYLLISKIIPTLANILIGTIIFLHLRGRNSRKALLGAGLYLLNPAIIYNTSYWGQVDSVNALFIFLSIILLERNRFLFATLAGSVAALIKMQSLIIIPVIWLITAKKTGVINSIKLFFINVFTIILLIIPYIQGGAFWHIIAVYFYSVGYAPFVTANAYNVWFLISPRKPVDWLTTLRDTTVVGGITLRSLSLGLLAAYLILVLYQLLKRGKIVLAAASLTCAFFIIPTEIHERYLFPFFPLMAILAADKKKYLRIFILLSITYLANLMMAFPFSGIKHPIFHPVQTILNAIFELDKLSFIGLACAIAALNVIVFAYFSRTGILKNVGRNIISDVKHLKGKIA